MLLLSCFVLALSCFGPWYKGGKMGIHKWAIAKWPGDVDFLKKKTSHD
jgi:hypothetical protein